MWGGDQTRAIPIRTPDGVQFVKISRGWGHNLALSNDGHVYAWGGNYWGQLGTVLDGGVSSTRVPVDITSRIPMRPGATITQISASESHSLVLDSDGRVYAFGSNEFGQLGNTSNIHTRNPNSTPTQVTGGALPAKVIEISAGGLHSLVVGSDHRVYAWGSNDSGQLGNAANLNVETANPTPVVVSGGALPSSVIQIDAGGRSSMALGSDHQAYIWGETGFSPVSYLPLSVRYSHPRGSILPPSILQISVSKNGNAYGTSPSFDHAVLLGSDHKAYGWGDNSFGQLGVHPNVCYLAGSGMYQITNSALPASIEQVSVGNRHTLLLGSNHQAYTFGTNYGAQLGNGGNDYPNISVACHPDPYQVPMPKPTITSVTFDGTTASKRSDNPTTGAWTVNVPLHPVGKVLVKVNWSLTYTESNGRISTVVQSAITLHYEYKVIYTIRFDLGEGAGKATGPPDQTVYNDEPLDWPTEPTWAGHQFTGWFKADGAPWNLADPVTANMTLTARWDHFSFDITPKAGPVAGNIPVTISVNPKTTSLRFTQISGGAFHTLAIGSDGNTYAWGSNQYGQLGDNTNANRKLPTRVQTPAGVHFVQVSTGSAFSLALGDDYNVYAWGWNAFGQLGNNTNTGGGNTNTTANPLPVKVTGGSLPANAITQVSAGTCHALALDNQGRIHAWGWNNHGQLGNNTNTGNGDANTFANPTPVRVSGGSLPATGITQISTRGHHGMALDTQGRVYAWGWNVTGQLGNSTNATGGNWTADTTANPTPTQVSGGLLPATGIIQISTGFDFSMALDSQSRIYTWGDNSSGQLGRSVNNHIETPNPVPGRASGGSLPASGIKQISAGTQYALALDTSGRIHAWGSNMYGQLGTSRNNYTSSYTPTQITGGSLPSTVNQISAGGQHVLALSPDGSPYAWGKNSDGQLGDDTNSLPDYYRPDPQPVQANKIDISSAEFGDIAHAITPTYQTGSGNWTGNSPAHPDGTVPVTIKWTKSGATQPDYTITPGFTYYTMFTLPQAGAIPLYRIGGGTLLALTTLAAVVYAGHEISKQRTQSQGKHSPRSSQAQPIK
ncbi:hypothetical protein KIMH_12310 [Bombiscardovia apis]|uniref:RCC1-like domain-containing protein n=1 Tax=Bombiscardovia apis TaxID=2932182 RepID=A0ABN6SKB4_9BIFI|nr:InlB B-repeat-containing protein [Bombiscardovia apis]BDR55120.1 hypothetical protein KIMH_12310 [Bombiscardovia apis]